MKRRKNEKRKKTVTVRVWFMVIVLVLAAGVYWLSQREPSYAPADQPRTILSEAAKITGEKQFASSDVHFGKGALVGHRSMSITYNLHGLCLLGGPASAVSFLEGSKVIASVPLASYGKNCFDGDQTAAIPLSAFAGLRFRSTDSLRISIWVPTVFTVSVRKIVVSPETIGVLGESSAKRESELEKYKGIRKLRPFPYAKVNRQ